MPLKIGDWGEIPAKGFKKPYHEDDLIDRLNHRYTAYLLMACAVLVVSKTYVGEPIHCWIPAETSELSFPYVNKLCWVQSKYRVPYTEEIPVNVSEREEMEFNYYQWVFLFLLLQVFLFKFPNVLWRLFLHCSNLPLVNICKLSHESQLEDYEERQKTIENIGDTLARWLIHNKKKLFVKSRVSDKAPFYASFCFVCDKRKEKRIVGFYLFTKALYVLNIVGQFLLVQEFLGNDFGKYGFQFTELFRAAKETKQSLIFPTEILCDYLIRQLNNVQRYTVQCVLPVNLFNEMVFLFLWFWFILVAVLTCYSFLKWMYVLVFKTNNYQYVKKYVKLRQEYSKTDKRRQEHSNIDKRLCKEFANDFLGDDGCFVARLVEMNSTPMTVMDLLEYMMKFYVELKKKKELEKKTKDTKESMEEVIMNGDVNVQKS